MNSQQSLQTRYPIRFFELTSASPVFRSLQPTKSRGDQSCTVGIVAGESVFCANILSLRGFVKVPAIDNITQQEVIHLIGDFVIGYYTNCCDPSGRSYPISSHLTFLSSLLNNPLNPPNPVLRFPSSFEPQNTPLLNFLAFLSIPLFHSVALPEAVNESYQRFLDFTFSDITLDSEGKRYLDDIKGLPNHLSWQSFVEMVSSSEPLKILYEPVSKKYETVFMYENQCFYLATDSENVDNDGIVMWKRVAYDEESVLLDKNLNAVRLIELNGLKLVDSAASNTAAQTIENIDRDFAIALALSDTYMRAVATPHTASPELDASITPTEELHPKKKSFWSKMKPKNLRRGSNRTDSSSSTLIETTDDIQAPSKRRQSRKDKRLSSSSSLLDTPVTSFEQPLLLTPEASEVDPSSIKMYDPKKARDKGKEKLNDDSAIDLISFDSDNSTDNGGVLLTPDSEFSPGLDKNQIMTDYQMALNLQSYSTEEKQPSDHVTLDYDLALEIANQERIFAESKNNLPDPTDIPGKGMDEQNALPEVQKGKGKVFGLLKKGMSRKQKVE
ncbi:hypothetical protein BKA69DRAFT_1038155 [Paraphysoderma sedebokerense]|nr:hypothetical protein BKA69DRAFT_1038155 [Paraphysoderma sedebokerense]